MEIPRTVDDLTGVEAETTKVSVTISGEKKTLDLTEQSLQALLALGSADGPKLLAKLFKGSSNGSRASNSVRATSTSNGGSGRTTEQLEAIRAWARETGYQQASGKPIADRGRVASDVIAAYDAAH